MRILLLGADGQLGLELKRSLAAIGTLTSFNRAGFDLTQPDKFRVQLRELKPEIVVNAAAYTAVDRAESEPDIARAVNSLATGILGEEARRLNALLVHFSTDYVFDGEKSTPYIESDSPKPLCIYGQSKYEGELAIQASGCRHLILRISWVYGVHGANFLKTILKIARNQPSISVVNDQWGTPITTHRLARTLSTLLANAHKPGSLFTGSPGTYHLSPSGCTTWYEYALHIVSRFGLETEVHPMTTSSLNRPARRPGNSLLDSTRFHRDFGLSVGHWVEGFEEVCSSLESIPG